MRPRDNTRAGDGLSTPQLPKGLGFSPATVTFRERSLMHDVSKQNKHREEEASNLSTMKYAETCARGVPLNKAVGPSQ